MKRLSIWKACSVGAAMAWTLSASVAGEADVGRSASEPQARQAQSEARLSSKDDKAPRLRSIRVGGKVDVSKSGPQAVVTLLATDNLSGVDQINMTLRSSSERQGRAISWVSSFDATRTEMRLGVDMTGASETGKWHIHSVELRDANGLSTFYGEEALATLGHTTFVVEGGSGDLTPPRGLEGGLNLTPTVSIWTPPPGRPRRTPARVGVQLRLADEGGAGVAGASMQFCLSGGDDSCITLEGFDNVRGQNEVTMTMGGYVSRSADVGYYFPKWLQVFDHAGNTASYGGNDLNSLLDQNFFVVAP